MKTRLAAAFVSLVAMVAAGSVRMLPANALSPVRAYDFTRRLAVRQLPTGFTLPSGDVNLKVSSLVTADLDADGDLDIVASERSSGSIGIVVWVNDGAGRLTRKAPAPTGNLAGEPALPSLDERQTTIAASVQPDGPAIAAIAANAWLTLPARRCDAVRSCSPTSVTPATLRSRSPPVLS
jgi:hypothetical protein